EYLTLNRKAERTVHCYVSFIYALAQFYKRFPDLLSHQDIQHWLYHLIAQRKQAPSTVNLAINAVRSFYGKMLQQDHTSAQLQAPAVDTTFPLRFQIRTSAPAQALQAQVNSSTV